MDQKTKAPAGLLGVMVLAAGLLGIVLWGSMLLAPWNLTTGLIDARDHLRRAEKALSRTELKVARYETLAAVGAVDRARDALAIGGPALDLARTIPMIDDALGEVDHLIAAADHSSKAALGTLNVAQDALRGPRAIIVEDPSDPKGEDKKFDLKRLEEVTVTITDVRGEIQATQDELEQVNLDKLPERLHDGIRDALKKAKEADATLADAEAGLEVLPAVLGANGARTYMIGFQNSAEQRGTGGAILRFGFMDIADGAPNLVEQFATVYDVDKDRQQVTIPLPEDAWYVKNIPDAQRFGNANWSPDWPFSAQLTVEYLRATPTKLPPPDIDGVIVLDPLAAQELMPGAGPFKTVPSNHRISSGKIVHFVLYKAYARYPAGGRRKVLNQVVDGFYERMFNPLHPTELLEGFGDALSHKHVQIWMADPHEQTFIEHMGWDGGLLTEKELKNDDYAFVVEQNVGGSKLDYFDTNTNTIDIEFDGNDALTTTEMRVRNGVFLPQPRYSMGDSQNKTACATKRCPLHRPMLNLYVREDAEYISAEVEGVRIDAPPSVATWVDGNPPTHFEHGKKVWSGTLEIPPQEEAALTLRYRVPDVLQADGERTVYRLHVQHQPKVQPEILVLRIRIPEGASSVRAAGFERNGDMLIWEKPIRTDLTLEVSWQE